MNHKLVLLRHGESKWNLENRFTGWTDVDLTNKGINEARQSGIELKKQGFSFDVGYTSFLKRAKHTLDICLNEMNLSNLPIHFDWRLNERHYGALQGLNKSDTALKYGDDQVLEWRRSYNIRPPSLKKDDPRQSKFEDKYSNIDQKLIPLTECLKDTVNRFLPIWKNEISKDIINGKKVIIAAHGNSLRALVKLLDNISDEEIVNINIPTGIPLIYELNHDLKAINNFYLGDEKVIASQISKVSQQAKIKL
jgi:2,3-bisphosphoglycerate-dependent phosphoglycerate mutase